MRVFAVVRVGEENVEKNTSKAFVESTGPLASALAPTGEIGTPLFLINLCASMAPVQLASKALPGLESYRLYQVTRVEDGRTRYRLRLGFFATEAEAEAVLIRVREQFPTAFTACLCEEDKRHTRGYVVAAPASKPQISVVPTSNSAPKAAAPALKKAAGAHAPQAKTQPATKAAHVPAASQVKATSAPSKLSVPAAPSKIQVASEPQKKTATPALGASTKMQSIAEITGLDDLSWEAPELNAPAPAVAAAGAKKPNTIPPVYQTQPVIKAEPKAKTSPPLPKQPEPKVEPKIDTAASMKVKALDLTFSDPPPPTPQASRPSNQPFHVGKGVEIPTTQLSLQADNAVAAAAAKTAAPARPIQTATSPARSALPPAKAPTPPPAAARPTIGAPHAKPSVSHAALTKHPDLDSTQTIRALTAEELREESQDKWFAIQLAASEQPVNLDAMPHLDIFEAYRLYSVATAGSGKIVHSLRLGFFKEEVSAEAVAGYLKTFFSSPTVLRISVAEQARFKDATLPKKAEPGEIKPQATVVELNAARSRAATVPTVTMEVLPGPDTSATGSFKLNSTGSFRTSETAKHRALTPTAKPAAKSAAPATKRSAPVPSRKKTSTSGKYKALPKKSLAQELLEEAKEVELSESGIFKMQKNDSSLLARLVDKLKK